ncbi:MAG: flagellar FlbD family protein [Clostridia bacterium]|nr:flagellar FlbD family protein [Clostridia bacterium]MCL6520962.1 flagellar FlbD family protein [Bacillota bacterium]
MIWLTRLNGDELVVNADMIETVEATPDTVITLANGHRWIVAESPDEVIRRVVAYRREIAAGPRREEVEP